uniref:Peptide-N(4)-(N-acetyl-beta-glucosaminyl) asparagine amidase A-like n=1 Tax=Tanacetum cinerariifolium TaxID=118510 RepID=A0A6L2N184_TANCI|nr:peptide-N(4)-(N-acetyl-beta-glucosaminyl) asparagine amidase A-like [Tanacetum cinerariifolium]
MTKDGDAQLVNQRIEFNDTVSVQKPASVSVTKSLKAFAFFIDSDTIDKGNGSYVSVANITLGFNEKKSKTSGSKTLSSVLQNVQNGQGSMLVKGNLVGVFGCAFKLILSIMTSSRDNQFSAIGGKVSASVKVGHWLSAFLKTSNMAMPHDIKPEETTYSNSFGATCGAAMGNHISDFVFD